MRKSVVYAKKSKANNSKSYKCDVTWKKMKVFQ